MTEIFSCGFRHMITNTITDLDRSLGLFLDAFLIKWKSQLF